MLGSSVMARMRGDAPLTAGRDGMVPPDEQLPDRGWSGGMQSLPNRRPHRGNPTWVRDQARRWYSPERADAPRHAVLTAQAGRAGSAIAAQAIRSNGTPDGWLSETATAYGTGAECQSGAIIPLIRI